MIGEDVTSRWLRSCQIQSVYTNNGTKQVTQVPVFIELLKQAGHQEYAELQKELTDGFRMTGPLTPGTGWLPRLGGRYAIPISMAELYTASIIDTCRRARPYKPSQMLSSRLETGGWSQTRPLSYGARGERSRNPTGGASSSR